MPDRLDDLFCQLEAEVEQLADYLGSEERKEKEVQYKALKNASDSLNEAGITVPLEMVAQLETLTGCNAGIDLDRYAAELGRRLKRMASMLNGRSIPSGAYTQPKGPTIAQQELGETAIEVLKDIGVEATVAELFDHVERRLAERFHQCDLETVSQGQIRWRNRLSSYKSELRKSGLLDESTGGVWKLAENQISQPDDTESR